MTITKKFKKADKNPDDWVVVKKNEFFSLEKNKYNFSKRRVLFSNELKVLSGAHERDAFLLAYGTNEMDVLGDYTLFNERFSPTLKTFYENGFKMEKFQFTAMLEGFRKRRMAKMENFGEYKESYFEDKDENSTRVSLDSSDEDDDDSLELEVEMKEETEVDRFFNDNLREIKLHMDSYYDYISKVKQIVKDFNKNPKRVENSELFSVERIMGGVLKAGRIIQTFLEKLEREKRKMSRDQSREFKTLSKHFSKMRREATHLDICKEMKSVRGAVKVKKATEVPNFMEKRLRAAEEKKREMNRREYERYSSHGGNSHSDFFGGESQSQSQVQEVGKRMRLTSAHATTMDATMQEQRETRRDLLAVSEEMNELQDLMNDLRELAYKQQDYVDTIEERVERSNLNVQEGRKQIRKAKQQQRLGRGGCLIQ